MKHLSTSLSPIIFSQGLVPPFSTGQTKRAVPLVTQWKRPLSLIAFRGGNQ